MTKTQHDRLTGKPMPEPPEGLFTLEELAQVADRSDQFTRATMDKLRQLVRSLETFAPQLAYLDALAEDAGLDATRDDRLHAGLQCNQELDRLHQAEDWQHPAEVLDPEGVIGIDYQELVPIAEARARRVDEPVSLLAIRDQLENARAAEQAGQDCVDAFVAALLAGAPQVAEILLRRAARAYRFHRRHQEREACGEVAT